LPRCTVCRFEYGSESEMVERARFHCSSQAGVSGT
jgi:hypothetical protein